MFSTDIIKILISKLSKHSNQVELSQPCLRTICNLTSSSNELLTSKLIKYGILDVLLGLIENPEIIHELLLLVSNIAASNCDLI